MMKKHWWFYLSTGLVVLPFLVAACYNHPLGVHEWDWISNYFGKLDHLNYWQEQAWWYDNIMGRYSNTALLSLTDAWYTLSRFRLVFIVMILVFCHAIWFFARSLYPTDRATATWIASCVIWIYFSGLTGVYDSIFRYSGILTYQIGLIGQLYWLGGVLRGVRVKWVSAFGKGIIWASALILPGFNEPVTFSTISLLALGIGILAYEKQKLPIWLWISFALFSLGLLIATLAPGNFTRMQVYGDGFSPIKACVLSIGIVGFQILHWLANTLLIPLTLLSLPILMRSKDQTSFRRAWLWAGVTVSLLFMIVFLLMYSTRGLSYPERIVDLMFVLFIFGWFGMIQTILNKYQDQVRQWAHLDWRPISTLLIIFTLSQTWLGGSRIKRENKQASKMDLLEISSPPGQISLDWVSGKLSKYDQQMHLQYQEIGDCLTDTCLLSSPNITPSYLYDRDSDRKTKPGGEPYQGSYWHQNIKILLYK